MSKNQLEICVLWFDGIKERALRRECAVAKSHRAHTHVTQSVDY